ncbi:hypothetical protein [Candidatus Poriferisodalis sp.]|uniref:hypothetical protein n=1 Tax=Candidatus Poriferisodalis sp. TaxID=3101277 RepID=UPI003B024134
MQVDAFQQRQTGISRLVLPTRQQLSHARRPQPTEPKSHLRGLLPGKAEAAVGYLTQGLFRLGNANLVKQFADELYVGVHRSEDELGPLRFAPSNDRCRRRDADCSFPEKSVLEYRIDPAARVLLRQAVLPAIPRLKFNLGQLIGSAGFHDPRQGIQVLLSAAS